ncbi:MAG TPA: DUF6318 family protein [Mycobacteriales bacterium]|nr:DUF6318 family protein [Mycobacteriales bacterium]
MLVVALGVTALTACSDDEPPSTLPKISASPSPSESAAGEVPEEAREATPEGAAEFVRFFYDRLEAAYAGPDPELVRPLVETSCEACARILRSLERLRKEQLQVDGHVIEVMDVVTPASQDSDKVVVTAVLRFSPYVERDARGTEVYSEPAAEQVVQDLELQRRRGAWVVTAVAES